MKNMRNSRLPTLKTAGRELSRVLNRVLKPLQPACKVQECTVDMLNRECKPLHAVACRVQVGY